jgi:hypothetical protein
MSKLGESLLSESKESLIDVTIYYTAKANKSGVVRYVILDDDESKAMLADEEKRGDVETINSKWKQSNWQEENSILDKCMRTNDMTGMPETDFIKYRDMKVKTMLKDWDLRAEDGTKINCNKDMINRLPAEIVFALLNKFESLTAFDADEQKK